MILYHISTDLTHDGAFIPRIPDIRHDLEDGSINRICFADSIEGCFTAMPNGASQLNELNMMQHGLYKLFTIDTDKYQLTEQDWIDCQTLYKRGLVNDAIITGEYWVTKPIQVKKEDMQIISLLNWFEGIQDDVPYEVSCLAEEKYDGDIEEAWLEYAATHNESSFIPACTEIERVTCHSSRLLKDGVFRIESVNEYELSNLMDSLNEYYPNQISITYNEDAEFVEIKVLNSVNLAPALENFYEKEYSFS